jgi:SAM-dependent MidA family methyltransferase
MTISYSLTSALDRHITQAIIDANGWISFDEFMAMALYTPGLGYYANDSAKFGSLPYAGHPDERITGSDFVTAPEMTPLFGQTLAVQVAQALQVTQSTEVWEFGAGSGALALQMLESLAALGIGLKHYWIVELSGSLRSRQQEKLKKYDTIVRWVSELPAALQGVVIGNEVLDAMPVKLLMRSSGVWLERGVALGLSDDPVPELAKTVPAPLFVWQDRPTNLRPPLEIEGEHDYLTEIHPQGEAFIRTLADKLKVGAAFFIDYGFPEHEYYHPQRHMGTVMCHQQHQSDTDPLLEVGLKDITAHVNFTALALAAQDANWGVLGYCTQARFLLNCGLLSKLEQASLPARVQAQKLFMEHEMGELFKVIGFYKGDPWQALGFSSGDRTETL